MTSRKSECEDNFSDAIIGTLRICPTVTQEDTPRFCFRLTGLCTRRRGLVHRHEITRWLKNVQPGIKRLEWQRIEKK